MKIKLRPCDFPVKLKDCPAGFFYWGDPSDKKPDSEDVCVKADHLAEDGRIIAFTSKGEEFFAGAKSEKARSETMVTPLKLVIEGDD